MKKNNPNSPPDQMKQLADAGWLLQSMMNAFVLFESVFDESGKFISYRFVYINDAYEKITGVKNDEVKGQTVHEVWPGTEQSWVEKYGHVAVTGETLEFDNFHAPTNKFYHCVVYRPWETKERFCVIFEDITEKRAKDVLLERIAENFPNSYISIIHKDLTIGFASGQEFRKQNLDPVAFIGLSLQEVFGEHTPVVKNHYLETFKGKEQSFELFINGQHQAYKCVPLPDENGGIERILVVVENITERKQADQALRKNEKKFRSLFDNLNTGLALYQIILDRKGRPSDFIFLDANPAYEKLTRLSRNEIIGKRGLEVFPEMERKWIDLFGRVALSGQAESVTHHSASRDRYWGVKAFSPAPSQFAVAINDITERVRSAQEMAAKEERYRNLLEHVSAAIGYFDPDGKCLLFNKEAAKHMDGDPADFVGKSFYDMFDENSARIYMQRLKTALSAEQVQEYLDEVKLPQRTRWLNSKYKKISDDNGDVVGVQIISTDISDAKTAELKLRRLNETLEAAQAMAKVGYWRIDIATMQPSWSEQMFAIMGVPKEEGAPAYRDHQKLWHPDDWEPFDQAVQAACRKGTPYAQVVRIRHGDDGSYHYVKTQGFPFRDEKGRIVELFGTSQDITDIKKAEIALNASEQRFAALVETINSGVAVYRVINEGRTGRDYIIQDFNNAALALEGKTKAEVVGKSLADLRPNIDDFGLIPVFRQVWKTGEPAIYPARLYADEKYENYYENRVFRLPSGEIVAVYDDVTDRELAARKIKESRDRYDLAMQSTRDGIFDWNLTSDEVYFSPGWKSMVGYAYDELPNDFSVWEKLTEPEDVQRTMEMISQLIKKEKDNLEIEFKMRHKDGHWVDVLSRARAYFDDNGNVVRIVGTHVDISERKAAEKKIKESEKRLRNALDASPFPTAVVDLQDDKIFFWSHSALELFGHTPSTTTEWYQLAYPDPVYRQEVIERWKPFLEKARKTQKPVDTGEYHITCSDGSVRTCELYATFLKEYLIVTIHDITERKTIERELEKYRIHLEEIVKERTRELEAKNVELEKYNELFIGREFRIKDLNEKIKELEAKLRNESH